MVNRRSAGSKTDPRSHLWGLRFCGRSGYSRVHPSEVTSKSSVFEMTADCLTESVAGFRLKQPPRSGFFQTNGDLFRHGHSFLEVEFVRYGSCVSIAVSHSFTLVKRSWKTNHSTLHFVKRLRMAAFGARQFPVQHTLAEVRPNEFPLHGNA